ncbi:hypothetical protein HBI56_086390 [Parastagonospora nodorum]|uniref:Uncharacterized protein n=1 Tax=Phaeosphaeria nodorum (strain SN15 / ATCC MYA-4574 / FGSC 10173) TaxID=321614 RepID=A0A7U2I4Y4_PHANO|nr:hypothetical protein HBH56_113200 [Parastagonospora nodorum]QRD03561.1 hypothetical protein JI435_442110 [Parastagonospora nodorum SN15]KAH3921493.1 hypothetical protein HBH54_239260 [Parastagonospora nodorum]KAH3951268.1 hypothetical protein HBH53_068870 [Parastagonospora nodorum]KAH3963023.1 hypothetical protein HBH51_169540 [Parastagonospora nodorum]
MLYVIMKVYHLLLLSFIAPTSIAQSNTYWVHGSYQNPKFNGGFDFGIKDALFMARRSLMRLNAPVSPYMDDIFLLHFRKPGTDIATLNIVKSKFSTLAL